MDLPLDSLINLPGHCLCVWPFVLLLTCCCSRPCHVFVVLLLTFKACLCCAAAQVHVMSLLCCCSRPCHVFVVLLLTFMSCLCCAAAHVHVMSLLCCCSRSYHVFVVLLLTFISCLCCAAAHVHGMSLLCCCSRSCHVFVVLLLTFMSCLCCAAAHVHVMSLLCMLSIQLSSNSIAGNRMGELNLGTFRYINEYDDTFVANRTCRYHTHNRAYFMMKFCGDFPVISDFSVIYHNSLTYGSVPQYIFILHSEFQWLHSVHNVTWASRYRDVFR